MNTGVKVVKGGDKYWLSIGTIKLGDAIDGLDKAEHTASWFKSAMPEIIKQIENVQLKKTKDGFKNK